MARRVAALFHRSVWQSVWHRIGLSRGVGPTRSIGAFVMSAAVVAAIGPAVSPAGGPAVWGVASALASESEPVIATVDINEVLNATPEAKTLKATLDKKAQALRQDIDKRRTALKAQEKKIKDKGAGAKQEEIDRFQKDARDFARMVKDSEQELQKEFRRANEELTRKAMDAVRSYADEHKVDLVLEKSKDMRSVVLFRAATMDITAEVIKRLE